MRLIVCVPRSPRTNGTLQNRAYTTCANRNRAAKLLRRHGWHVTTYLDTEGPAVQIWKP